MAVNLHAKQFLRTLPGVRYATKASLKPEAAEAIQKQEPKLSKLPNGLVVASYENYDPIARIAVLVKAGSRYEDHNNLGISHALRNAAGLSTKNHTGFAVTRNINQIGGSLLASADRETISYSLECKRDSLDVGLNFLAQVSVKPVFKPWEVSDNTPRLKLDLALLHQQPQLLVLENLHKAAYRTGLGNSLYSPEHMIGEHEPEMLADYVKQNFTADRMAVVGVGISHEMLVEYANKVLQPSTAAGNSTSVVSKYGGGEIRVENGDPLSYVAVVTEGASASNTKDLLSLALLQNIMGFGPRSKYATGSATSRLAQAASRVTNKPFGISAINLNYSDTGLFGFFAVAQPEDMGKVLKEVFSQHSAITKSGVKDEEVKRAKHQLIATLSMATEGSSGIVEELGSQALTSGQLTSLAQIEKAVEAITVTDVKTIAKKVINGKPSMAAVGNLSHTPYLDQLL
jgi:ubiquinol-cytochrome c reductase core subunit 2